MNKETALSMLIANVYCEDSRLNCTECPLYEEGKSMRDCDEFEDDDLLEAVKVLNE